MASCCLLIADFLFKVAMIRPLLCIVSCIFKSKCHLMTNIWKFLHSSCRSYLIIHGKTYQYTLLLFFGQNLYKLQFEYCLQTIKAFLPSMVERNEGHIVTVSSSAGLHGTPYLSDYSASKFALNGLHESLSLELREQGAHGIKFTIVHPNFINTGMSWHPKTRY